MLEGSIPVALIFKIHYKAMFSAFSSKHKFQSQKGETLLLQTDLSHLNTVVPKAIQWKDISLPEDWILEGAAPPELPPPPQLNVQIKNITQYTDEKVKLSFHRHSTSSRFSETSSSSSTIDLGRISKIPSVINIPYHANLPRKSTSDIPSTSFQNTDHTTNIPKPVYTNFEQPSPPTSPTFSAVTENIQNELNVLTSEKHFVINKPLLKSDFYGDHNMEKRSWFFQHFLQQRNDIQKQFYAYIETHNVQILFFDWFEFHYVLAQHIAYPFASIKHACPITTRSKTPIWTFTSGPTVEFDYPPLHNIQLSHKNQTVDAAPYKLPSEDTLTNTKHTIQQNNFINTNLHTIGKQLTRLEKQIKKNPAHFITDKTPIDLKLKNSVFKPYQVTQTSQAQIQENQTDFLRAIKIHLQNLDQTTLTVLHTPQQSNPSSSTNQVNTLQNNLVSTSDTDTIQEQPVRLNRLTWQAPKTTIAPDISISTEPTVISQHKYNASSLYQWNIVACPNIIS